MADAEQEQGSLTELIDSWRGRLDDLKVQADLGRMDARDRIRGDLERAEGLWTELKGRVEELGDKAASTGGDLADDLKTLVEDLRSALRSAADRISTDLSPTSRADDAD